MTPAPRIRLVSTIHPDKKKACAIHGSIKTEIGSASPLTRRLSCAKSNTRCYITTVHSRKLSAKLGANVTTKRATPSILSTRQARRNRRNMICGDGQSEVVCLARNARLRLDKEELLFEQVYLAYSSRFLEVRCILFTNCEAKRASSKSDPIGPSR
jgi:hypothetical protein